MLKAALAGSFSCPFYATGKQQSQILAQVSKGMLFPVPPKFLWWQFRCPLLFQHSHFPDLPVCG